MPSTTPEAAGHAPTEPLEPIGRARRSRCAAGELWRLPASDEALVARLLGLGRRGLGGVCDGGLDDEGAWLVRRASDDTLASALHRAAGPTPWPRALAIALAVARAQAACEAASLFVGPLTPRAVVLAGDEVWLPADGYLGALVGAPAPSAVAETGPKGLLWAPPETAEAGVWDNAANRYAIGVMLYELCAGAHPFGGAGLRHALDEARRLEPAPLPEEAARALPPGLQSFCLRMLDTDPTRRPARAADIVAELEHFAVGREATGYRLQASGTLPSKQAAKAPRAKPVVPAQVRELKPEAWSLEPISSLKPFLPLAVGAIALAAAIAAGANGLTRPSAAEPRAFSGTIAPLRPVDRGSTEANDCASCHPAHAASWSQSVMAHAVKSPLFQSLEMLIEEQVGRDRDCPGGAGILRRSDGSDVCRDRQSGITITGSGGEHWCVNCHAPGENLEARMPAWRGGIGGDPRSRLPIRDLITQGSLEGISCAFCHQVHGPVGRRGSGGYEGNPDWVSFVTGARFLARPEDDRGLFGIANSGYQLDPGEMLLFGARNDGGAVLTGPGGFAVHARPSAAARRYLASSEFCGSCHDVRLFGSDVLGAQERGEHFKRLRNAYTEWTRYAEGERRAGREAATCQGCHMSTYPGTCVPDAGGRDDGGCPEGTRFEAAAPGQKARGAVATSSDAIAPLSPHYFSAVDLPLAADIGDAALDQDGLDAHGLPLSAKRRRNLLLRRSMELSLGEAQRRGTQLEIPVEIANVGAGHKIPAGFSQEREIWVHLRVTDRDGRVVYEVGRVDRNDEDLRDKQFVQVNADPDFQLDGIGRPLGLFGANVIDGPDVPRWSPPPDLGASELRGRGLINLQNGFLRCVQCIGVLGPSGECEAGPGQGLHRADRFADGDYDIDTGECRSNLSGRAALFEIFYPVGALDAERGITKGPDAIIDTRALDAGERRRYTYDLDTRGRPGPFRVEARLFFRSFPPFLVKAFADYERRQAARGQRPSGPLVSLAMLERLERVELARQSLVIP